MTTETDLANSALAYLGEMPISSIDDAASKPARVCRQFARQAMDEVLRMSRWNCAIKRQALARDVADPISGFAYAFILPTDFLRALEVNDDEYRASSEFYEMEGRRILSNEEAVTLRYVRAITIAQADPLLAEAMALRLASKVCVALTGSAEKSTLMLSLYGKALAEARQADAQECGSRENSSWTRIFSRSRLLNVRGKRRNPLRMEDY
jgi:hypothetical protein